MKVFGISEKQSKIYEQSLMTDMSLTIEEEKEKEDEMHYDYEYSKPERNARRIIVLSKLCRSSSYQFLVLFLGFFAALSSIAFLTTHDQVAGL
jgi:hypothetical protein